MAKSKSVNTVKMETEKPKRKPCEPPSSQKKHKNWRRCKWQFNTICLCYPDREAWGNGLAMYLDRTAVTDEMCKEWFMPIDDNLASGEQHFCRMGSAFVEIDTAKVARRVRSPKDRKVIGYQSNLFGESTEKLSTVIRPEGSEEY